MDPDQKRDKPLWPVLTGLLFVLFVALGIGILLPDAVRGYDVEHLVVPAFETRLELDQKDLQAEEADLARAADYVTWKAYAHAECAVLDLGDIRIAVPRHRTRGAKTWSGRIKIRTDATPPEVDEKEPYRVEDKSIFFAHQWKDGINQCNFCDARFTLEDGKLHIGGQVYAFGQGHRLLVVNREGRIEAGLEIAADGSLHQLPID